MRPPLLHPTVLLLAVFATLPVQAQVSIEIVDMPRRVHSFEPVYVLYAIENTGDSPVYLPADGFPGRGATVYFAPAGETPRWFGLTGDWVFPHAERTIWLAPGERWLTYQDIGGLLALSEGEVAVQAVLSSQGRCGDRQVGGRKSFPLSPLRVDTFEIGGRSHPVYRCWEGEIRSSTWKVTVERPDLPVDLEAHDYLVESRSLIYSREAGKARLIAGWKLEDRFPESHYTYAALAGGGAGLGANRKALDLHPHHPLNPWVRTAILAREMEQADGATPVAELRARVAEMDLPAGAVEYLEQQAWVSEHRRQDGEGSP